jgi:hypothetical protein
VRFAVGVGSLVGCIVGVTVGTKVTFGAVVHVIATYSDVVTLPTFKLQVPSPSTVVLPALVHVSLKYCVLDNTPEEQVNS